MFERRRFQASRDQAIATGNKMRKKQAVPVLHNPWIAAVHAHMCESIPDTNSDLAKKHQIAIGYEF